MKTAAILAAILVGGTLVTLRQVAAQEKQAVDTALSTRDFLAQNQGKHVSLRLAGGEALEGTVAKVGDHQVHIAALSGRDYYDALVSIDRVEAVIFRRADAPR